MAQQIVTPRPPASAQQPRRRGPGAWSRLLAVAAAVAIVATLAAVFQALPHSRVARPAATPTPNFAAHVTHARGHWADVVQYTAIPTQLFYVVPNDPRIAYRAVASQAKYTLARSDDGGATWTTLPLPTDDGGSFIDLLFSPLDPQTVFLTLASYQTTPHCPISGLGPGIQAKPGALANLYADSRLGPQRPTGGGYGCYFQYVSRDGGATWSHPTFPWPAQHFADIGYSDFPGPAQGTTLFAVVSGDLNGTIYDGVRLVASEDGGSTWTAVDSAIFATGQIVTSYTAIPGTTSLYAISAPQQIESGQESSAVLWSSQDGGAHWSRIGPAPVAQAELIGTTRTPGGPTLYAVGLTSASLRGPMPIYSSRDGGYTWSLAPTASEPQGQLADPWRLVTLADGSLLAQFYDAPTGGPVGISFSNSDVTFYAWRPGDAEWFPVTPRPASDSVTQLWLASPANGPQALWIVVESQQGPAYTVRECVLQ